METAARSHLLVLTHVPKCGGTSVDEAMWRAVGGEARGFRHSRAKPASGLTPEQRAQMLFLSGHFSWNDPVLGLFPQTPVYLATVREPVSRLISSFSYRREKAEKDNGGERRARFVDGTLDEFVARMLRKGEQKLINKQCSFFAGAASFQDARRVIADRYAIAVPMRAIDRMVALLHSYVAPNRPQVPAPHVNRSASAKMQIDPALEAKLREAMKEDIQLVSWLEDETERMFERAKSILDPLADRLVASAH